MRENSSKIPFNTDEARRVLDSAEGKRLLALLSRDGSTLRAAAQAFQSGDTDAAKALLQPLVDTPEAGALLQKINRK